MCEGVEEVYDLVVAKKLEETYRKIRYELHSSKKSSAVTKVYIELLKIEYWTTRSYSREVNLFVSSNKSDEYKRRISLVSKVYSFLFGQIQNVAENACIEDKQRFNIAANDNAFLGVDNQDGLLILKTKISHAKALLGLIFYLHELNLEIIQKENSEAYSEILLKYLKVIEWFIKMGFVGLSTDWGKEKPASKKLFDTLIKTTLQRVGDLNNTVNLYSELKQLEPIVNKFNTWQQQLITNQKKATKASTKYDDDVKSKWVETADALKNLNPNLSISAIAKKIAENQPGSQETIRKFLAEEAAN